MLPDETEQRRRSQLLLRNVQPAILDLLEAGGLQFMIPIGLCSILGLTIIIERSISLRRRAIIPRTFMSGLKAVFHHDSGDRAAGLSPRGGRYSNRHEDRHRRPTRLGRRDPHSGHGDGVFGSPGIRGGGQLDDAHGRRRLLRHHRPPDG